MDVRMREQLWVAPHKFAKICTPECFPSLTETRTNSTIGVTIPHKAPGELIKRYLEYTLTSLCKFSKWHFNFVVALDGIFLFSNNVA